MTELPPEPPDGDLLGRLAAAGDGSKLPPVNDWHPEKTWRINIRIDREGRWYYKDSEIRRPAMVKLFASILRHDDDGYCLVTPTERLLIRVDCLPLVATEVVEESGRLVFTLNTGETVVADVAHPLVLADICHEQVPTLHVRDRLAALIHRNVFYQLVETAEEMTCEEGRCLVVASGGALFRLGLL